jgi:hypothetical protein
MKYVNSMKLYCYIPCCSVQVQNRLDVYGFCILGIIMFMFKSVTIKIAVYKNLILPVILYGCETWPPTLREERRLEGRF